MITACFTHSPYNEPPVTWRDESTDLEWVFASQFGTVKIRRRITYPQTFAFVRGAILLFGYGQLEKALQILDMPLQQVPQEDFFDDEFLLIVADGQEQTVQVQRDAYVTLPLFCGTSGTCFVLSNAFAYVTTELPELKLNWLGVVNALVSLSVEDETILDGVQLVTERARITWAGNKLSTDMPADRPAMDEVSDPHLFKIKLEDAFDRTWQRYGNQEVIFELSGGVDSAIAPGYYARRKGLQPHTITKLFPGDFSLSQRPKIADFQTIFNAKSQIIPIEYDTHLPLRRILLDGETDPVYESFEIYTEIGRAMAEYAAASGATAIFTGFGGDELCEHIPPTMKHYETAGGRRFSTTPASFYTPVFKQEFQKLLDSPIKQSAIPLCSLSAISAGFSGNNIYIERGIWPVSPLADPALYGFSRSLPRRFTHNKNILRAYMEAVGYPESIYNPTVNEDASPFFHTALMAYYPKLTRRIIDNSVLSAAGYVDPVALAKLCDDVRAGALPHRELFNFYKFVVVEHNLQTLKLNLV